MWFGIQHVRKSKLPILGGLLFLFFALVFSPSPVFSEPFELPSKTFTFPGTPDDVFQATIDTLKIESIPIAEQNRKEGLIRSEEFPIRGSEFKQWAKSRFLYRKAFGTIYIKIQKKNDHLSILEIAPEFRKNPRLSLSSGTKYVSSKGYFEELLAAKIYALLITQKYPTILQLAIGCNFEQDEKTLTYRVGELKPKSFGEEQGFKEGDLVREIDGVPVTIEDFFEILTKIDQNTRKMFKLERDGKTIQLKAYVFFLKSDLPWVGVRVERNEETGDFYVAEIMPNSPASEAGLRVGDVLLEEEGTPFDSWKKYYRVATSTKPGVGRHVTISRNGIRKQLVVTPRSLNPISPKPKSSAVPLS